MMDLYNNILACTICKPFLPNPPNPIVRYSKKSKIVIIGQAPGNVVNRTGIPFNDKSGETLRKWLGVSSDEFYDTDNFAIVPMGFCFPGKGKTGGDAPPRKECAPKWHHLILSELENVQLILLVGSYAINSYLREEKKRNLTETVRHFSDYMNNNYLPIVHPSPLNYRWHSRNKWFIEDVVPVLQHSVKEILENDID